MYTYVVHMKRAHACDVCMQDQLEGLADVNALLKSQAALAKKEVHTYLKDWRTVVLLMVVSSLFPRLLS